MPRSGNMQPAIDNAEHIGPDDTGDNIEAKRVANYTWNGTNWERNNSGGLDTLIDEVSSTVTYVGEAASGAATSAALWRIQKIDSTSNPTSVKFADGAATFTKIWDSRTGYTY